MAGHIGNVDHDPDHEQQWRYLAQLTKDIFGTEFWPLREPLVP